jgi:hypothetical protein
VQTGNKDYYLEALRYVKVVEQRRTAKNVDWRHVALVPQFTSSHSAVDSRVLDKVFDFFPFTTFYSTDLSPPGLILFLKTRVTLRRRIFQTVWDIILNATDYLRMIQQTSFELRFQKWKGREEWRVVIEENCFEVDTYN